MKQLSTLLLFHFFLCFGGALQAKCLGGKQVQNPLDSTQKFVEIIDVLTQKRTGIPAINVKRLEDEEEQLAEIEKSTFLFYQSNKNPLYAPSRTPDPNSTETEQAFSTKWDFLTPNQERIKENGYTDTVARMLPASNSTLFLRCYLYDQRIYAIKDENGTEVLQLYSKGLWVLEDEYGQILETISQEGYTKPYPKVGPSIVPFLRSSHEVVWVMFQSLQKEPGFIKHRKRGNMAGTEKELLYLSRPQQPVSGMEQIMTTAVQIKCDTIQSSGVIISGDGYILTTYDAVFPKIKQENTSLTIAINDTQQWQARVVRINREANLALLKVEQNFAHAVLVPEEDNQNLSTIYCVGFTDRVLLGPIYAKGIVSAYQKVYDQSFLQLDISARFSGAPVYDSTNQLVALMVIKPKVPEREGVRFAVPTNTAFRLLAIQYKD